MLTAKAAEPGNVPWTKNQALSATHTPPPRKLPGWWQLSLLLLGICLMQMAWGMSKGSTAASTKYLTYDGESIAWEHCGQAGDHPLECSRIEVPMDHFDQANSGSKTFNIPLIRLRRENATRNVIMNPGGPGGSGIMFVQGLGEHLSAILGDGFHLMSFDPRGVNGSSNLASCYKDEETRDRLWWKRSARLIEDSVDLYAWTRNFVRGCADTMGEHGKYINTPQTAADMNTILDALGQENMLYWGFSYGTLLGQTYATMFPDRSERVIIDGVVDQELWYEKPISNAQFDDTANVLHGFVDECFKAGDRCALSSLANSTEELELKIYEFADDLEVDPLSVYIDENHYGVLDYYTFWYDAIFHGLYQATTWPLFASLLSQLMQGNTTEPFLMWGNRDLSRQLGDAEWVVDFNDGQAGPQFWPQERRKVQDEMLSLDRGNSFFAQQNKLYYAKQQWAIPRTHQYKPLKRVQTQNPLLLLSTTYDPICPLSVAKKTREIFDGSRLVELKTYGHCTFISPSVCTVKHIRSYLYQGKLPEDHVTFCELDVEYFPALEKRWRFSAADLDNMEEEERIIVAQHALAEKIQSFVSML